MGGSSLCRSKLRVLAFGVPSLRAGVLPFLSGSTTGT